MQSGYPWNQSEEDTVHYEGFRLLTKAYLLAVNIFTPFDASSWFYFLLLLIVF